MSNVSHLWYLMDSTHGAYNGRITAMTAQHAREWPTNAFSVVDNDAGTQALVKLDAAQTTAGEITAQDNSPATITKYVPATHATAKALLQEPEWSNTQSA